MTYSELMLEVPFGLGDLAEFDQEPSHWIDGVKPMTIIDVVLYSSSIPDLATTDGVYFATSRLGSAMVGLTGLRRRDFTISLDDQMRELGEFDGWAMPELMCFEVTGTYGVDDFAHVEGVIGLLASERAVAILAGFDLGSGTVSSYVP